MLHELKDYKFKEFCFTNYKARLKMSEIYNFVQKDARITTVYMFRKDNILFNNKKFNKIGIKIGLHTLNNKRAIKYFLSTGVSEVYSDFLCENNYKLN